MTEPFPYFALLSYNAYGKTSERELAIAECKALAPACELGERVMGIPSPVSIRHAAFIVSLMKTLASAPTIEALCSEIESRQGSATGFKTTIRKIPPALPAASPDLQRAVARAIRGKPNLDHPTDRLLLVVTARRLWLGKIMEECENRWRLYRVRPVPYIRSLPTRVARAVLNLVARPGDRIVDPCCGAGTFLVEAADMNIQAEGYDINPKMVSASNINLQHFGFAPVARAADARTLTGRWDAVVTDLPYGHISNYEDAKTTPEILGHLPSLAPRLAVVTAKPQEPALTEAALAPAATIPLPVSRTLTRYIHVVGSR